MLDHGGDNNSPCHPLLALPYTTGTDTGGREPGALTGTAGSTGAATKRVAAAYCDCQGAFVPAAAAAERSLAQ